MTAGGQDAITAPSSTPLPTGQLRRLEMTCAAPAAGPAVFPVSSVRLPPQQQQHQHLLHHHNSCSISPPRTTAALTLLRPQRGSTQKQRLSVCDSLLRAATTQRTARDAAHSKVPFIPLWRERKKIIKQCSSSFLKPHPGVVVRWEDYGVSLLAAV